MKTIKMSEVSKLLGAFIRVENAPSRNGYGKAPNQFILHYKNGEVFQSYDSIVGVMIDGYGLYFGVAHDYSNTTSGYVGRWSGFNTKERRQGIESGKFGLITK
jgi:hypothetical protein